MKKRIFLLVLPVITIILELLPGGAVLNFANPEGEPFRETFSYFSFTPFGYANFGPLVTAVASCLIFAVLAVYCKTGNTGLLKSAKVLLCVCIFFSLAPIMMFGIRYFSLIGAFITASLAIELLLLIFIKKPYEPKKQAEVLK